MLHTALRASLKKGSREAGEICYCQPLYKLKFIGLGIFNTIDEMKAAYGEPDSMEDSVSGKKYVYIQNDELLEFWENPGEGIVAMHSMIYTK